MPVSYKRLFELMEKRGLKKYDLRKNGINAKVVDALQKNNNVNVSSIMELCELLDCQPQDIMEYIPSETTVEINRGDIWWADLSAIIGEEEGGLRPVLILKDNEDTVIGAPITTKAKKTKSTHIQLNPETSGLPRKAVVLLENLRVIDKSKLSSKSGKLDEDTFKKIINNLF